MHELLKLFAPKHEAMSSKASAAHLHTSRQSTQSYFGGYLATKKFKQHTIIICLSLMRYANEDIVII